MTARVWNDNVYPYEENFKKKVIHIPAKGYVEMDENDAKLLVRQYRMPRLDGMGQQKPETFKMLRVEISDPDLQAEEEELICHATGDRATSQEELDKMIDERLDDLVDEKVAKKRRGRPPKKRA